MAVEQDPLDVMEKQLREIESARKRYAATPASEMDAEWACSELRDTLLPLLSDFMLLTFNAVAGQQEYLEREVQPLVIAEAEREQDPSQLEPEDAELFGSLISEYQASLKEALAALGDPQGEPSQKIVAKIEQCQEALDRIEEVTLDFDDDEEDDEEGDEDEEGDDDSAEVVSLPHRSPGSVDAAAHGSAPQAPPEPET